MTPYIQGKALVLPRTNSKKVLIVRHTPENRLKNEIAFIKKIMKIINRKTSDCYRTVELDALTPASEPRCEIQDEVEQDYTEYENVVKSLNLTENMRVALECRIKGLSYPEIGRVLSRVQSTVFEYFIKMRQRYTKIYG